MELTEEKIMLKSKLFYHYFEPIANALNGINYAVVKGEPLSFYAYGNFGKRYFSDIDLLVSKDDINFVTAVLEENGFESLSKNRFFRAFSYAFSHQIIPFVKRIGNFSVYVDVNFNIFWGEYEGQRIPMNEFLADTVPIQIYKSSTKTLPHIKFFIHLVLHHYKDLNSIFLLASQKTVRVSLFRDMYNYLVNYIMYIPLEELLQYSTKYGINDYVYYMLFYVCVLYDNDEIKKYRDAFRTIKGEGLLNKYGLSDTERKEWRIDFFTRLNEGILYDYIKKDLTLKDKQKIEINKKIFMME